MLRADANSDVFIYVFVIYHMSMQNLGQIPLDKAYLFSKLALPDTVYMVSFIWM